MKIQAIGVIGYLSFLLVPLIERKYDKEKYLQSVLGNKIITIFFSMVFYLGITFIMVVIDALLINFNSNIYINIFSLKSQF